METAADTTTDHSLLQSNVDIDSRNPFSQQQVTITKAEHIDLIQRAKYWEALHAQLKQKCARLEEESQRKDARIRDLNNRAFGKKSEKQSTATSEKSEPSAYKKHKAHHPRSRHLPNHRRWRPSPPNPAHFATNSPTMHWLFITCSPILSPKPIESPPRIKMRSNRDESILRLNRRVELAEAHGSLEGYDLNIVSTIDFILRCQRQSILADLIPEL